MELYFERCNMSATTELIQAFSNLCDEFVFEDIDTDELRKGVSEVIDNYC